MRKANNFLPEFVRSSDTANKNAIKSEDLQRYDKAVSRTTNGCAVLQKSIQKLKHIALDAVSYLLAFWFKRFRVGCADRSGRKYF